MTTSLTILGFDTSGPAVSCALMVSGAVLIARNEDMAKGQAERLLPLLEEVLAEAGVSWHALDAIAVGTGPGNFTGIRISVAAARGLALSLGVPAVGVSMLEALAFGTDAPVLSCLDARRNRLYLQRFHPTRARGPELVALSDTDDWALPDLTCVGPLAQALGRELGLPIAHPAFPPAEALVRVAATRWQTVQTPPAPLYMRAADAAPPADPPPVILPS